MDWFENSIHPLNEAERVVISFLTGVSAEKVSPLCSVRHSVSIQGPCSTGPRRVPDGNTASLGARNFSFVHGDCLRGWSEE